MNFEFEIEQRIAELSRNASGYSLELNRVSYNGNPAKLDLRKWHDGQPMKGITLSEDEARRLLAALQGLSLEGGAA